MSQANMLRTEGRVKRQRPTSPLGHRQVLTDLDCAPDYAPDYDYDYDHNHDPAPDHDLAGLV